GGTTRGGPGGGGAGRSCGFRGRVEVGGPPCPQKRGEPAREKPTRRGAPAMIHRLARRLLAAAAASTWPWTAERPAGRTRWSGIPPAWSAPRPTYSSPFHDGRSIMDQGDSREASVNARGGPGCRVRR